MLSWNRESVASGLVEISRCRAELLLDLKYILDDYHRWEKPPSYYDILAGDWLEFFAHLGYIATLESKGISTRSPLSPIPVTTDLLAHSRGTWQNGHLQEHLRNAVTRLLDGETPEKWAFSTDFVHIASGHGDGLGTRIIRTFANPRPEALLVEPYFKCSRQDTLKTLLRWRRWATLDNLKYPVRVAARVDQAWRTQRATSAGKVCDLKGLLRTLMPLHLPVALLEGFSGYRNAVLAMPVHRPKVVYSANALHNHLSFKLLTAEWREEGTRLLYHQHGGGYGVDQTHVIEEFETRVSDRYFSWGWTSDNAKVTPLSPAMPHTPKRRRKHILLSCANFPRVAFRLHFHPMPGTIETLHQETCAFLAGLPNHASLLVRPYADDYGWGAVDMMRKAAPDAQFDDRRTGSFERFAQSSLVVHNYLGTAYLETLALNIPTVCFFDCDTYSFRPDAQILIDALEHVGILHRSGAEAAKFVSGLGSDFDAWWAKSEVQDARCNFIARYANFSPDWQTEWEDAFQAEILSAT